MAARREAVRNSRVFAIFVTARLTGVAIQSIISSLLLEGNGYYLPNV